MPRKKLPVTFTADVGPRTSGCLYAGIGKRELFGIPFYGDYGTPYVPEPLQMRVGQIMVDALNAHGDELRALYDAAEAERKAKEKR